MAIITRRLVPGDHGLLSNVAPDVFDDPINMASTEAFLAAPNSVLVTALDDEKDNLVVGFASALIYLHPDKAAPEMAILELGVDDAYTRRGIGKAIMDVMLAAAKDVNCSVAWVTTQADNAAALALYKSAGGDAPDPCVLIDIDLAGEP